MGYGQGQEEPVAREGEQLSRGGLRGLKVIKGGVIMYLTGCDG